MQDMFGRPELPGEVVRTGSFAVALPPDAALELFTAAGEIGWAPGWEPRYVTPPEGTPVEGGVWLTRDGEIDVVWRVERFDRVAREAEYLRITPGHRLALVQVRCAAEGDATRVTVSYRVVALSDAGLIWLDGFSEEHYAAMMREWERLIADHVASRG